MAPGKFRWVDRRGNVYEECPICGKGHSDERFLAACYVRRNAAWRRARVVDGLSEPIMHQPDGSWAPLKVAEAA